MPDQPAPAFLTGQSSDTQLPLGRYLPPILAGSATRWLEQQVAPGGLILDPFGAAPQLAVEAARAGYRLLVAVNNPILRLVLEMLAEPPSQANSQAVLAALASARIRDERIEPHIRSLYASHCVQCGAGLQPEAFLWQAGAKAPMAKFYTCRQCGDTGERQVSESDLLLAKRYAETGLHHARALERVAPLNDPDRVYVEEALTVYPPRAVYALITLVNKLDSLQLAPSQQRILEALLLLAFESGNTLWPYPGGRDRPRQLTIPPLYRENNLWLALERAVDLWSQPVSPVALANWPELPPAAGGISIFQGRSRELFASLNPEHIQAVLTALPRPNQAFWTLSALWAGWLWGPEALTGIKSVLRRQRYGWGWHTAALQAALESLPSQLPGQTPCLALIGEAEAGFLSAALLAGRLAGLQSAGMALRQEQAQIHWHIPEQALPAPARVQSINNQLDTQLSQAAKELIIQAAEPQAFTPMYAAGLLEWANHPFLPDQTTSESSPAELHSLVQNSSQQAYSYRQGFLRFGGSEKNPTSGLWWLQAAKDPALPLSDRVEMAVVKALLQDAELSYPALDESLCTQFPGLLTPDRRLLQACLDSYAEQLPTPGLWRLKPNDTPANRRQDLDEISRLIAGLANRLAYQLQVVDENNRVIDWLAADGTCHYRFYLSASALLGKIFIAHKQITAGRPSKQVVLLPGGRANLAAFKLSHNPAAQLFFEEDWYFVKFRHWRRLVEDPGMSNQRFEQQLSLDPLTYSEPQLRML